MYNPLMLKWCSRSIYKHFKTAYSAITPVPLWKMYFEGDYKISEEDNNEKVEIRFDGPHDRELSKGYWLFQLKLNALITLTLRDNIYRREEILGDVRLMLTNSIPVYNDDDEIVNCFVLQAKGSLSGKTGVTKNSNFGQIQPRLPLLQATLDANYAMEFKE